MSTSIKRKATEAWERRFEAARELSDKSSGLRRVTKDMVFNHPFVGGAALTRKIDNLPEEFAASARAEHAENFVDNIAHSMVRGRTLYASAQMTALAAESVDDFTAAEVPVDRKLMPSPNGWLWLEEPIRHTDVWGNTYHIRAMSWSAHNGSLVVTQWGDNRILDKVRPEYVDALLDEQLADYHRRGVMLNYFETRCGLTVFDWSVLHFGEPVVPEATEREQVAYADFLVNYIRNNSRADLDPAYLDLRESEIRAMTVEEMHALSGYQTMRLLQVLWALSLQTVVKKVGPDKHARKRVTRGSRQWVDPSNMEEYLQELGEDIHVLTLRTEYQPDSSHVEEDPGGGTRWTHRWAVRPYWRWQHHKNTTGKPCPHCGSEGWLHVWTLIPPHVKGPEHLPFVEKNVVDCLVR